tara:strand:+ start:158 stop:544 length:387 start_codon:yes stop_codon:yes gene_type:complete
MPQPKNTLPITFTLANTPAGEVIGEKFVIERYKGDIVYTKNVRITISGDAGYEFPEELSSARMVELVDLNSNKQVQLSDSDYEVSTVFGTSDRKEAKRDKDEGWCSLTYVPKYVRSAGQPVPEGGLAG